MSTTASEAGGFPATDLVPGTARVRKIRWNLPNLLTVARVLVVPLLMGLLVFSPARPGADGSLVYTLAMVLTLAAGITDAVDGHLARTRQEVTRFGRLIDPVADKLLATGVFVLLVEKGAVAGWVVGLLLGREFAVMGLRMVLAAEGVQVAVSRWAKVKTIFQMVALVAVLLHLSLQELAGGGWLTVPVSVVIYYGYLATACVFVSLGLTLITGVQYFRDSWPHLGS